MQHVTRADVYISKTTQQNDIDPGSFYASKLHRANKKHEVKETCSKNCVHHTVGTGQNVGSSLET